MEVLEVEEVVEQVAVQFASLRVVGHEALDADQALAHLSLGHAVETRVEFVVQRADGIVAVEVQPAVLGAGQVEEPPDSPDAVHAQRRVLGHVEER